MKWNSAEKEERNLGCVIEVCTLISAIKMLNFWILASFQNRERNPLVENNRWRRRGNV